MRYRTDSLMQVAHNNRNNFQYGQQKQLFQAPKDLDIETGSFKQKKFYDLTTITGHPAKPMTFSVTLPIRSFLKPALP